MEQKNIEVQRKKGLNLMMKILILSPVSDYQIRATIFPDDFLHNFCPVSYTHLDVYKRQTCKIVHITKFTQMIHSAT